MISLELKNEIVSRLNAPHDVKRIILFGSHAKGTADSESDIDIVVILDKKGISRTYSEMLENRIKLSERIRDISKKNPIDLLSYTSDEWESLVRLDNDFVRNIEDGVVLL